MSNNSKNHRKSLKDLNMIDNFMWAEATEDPENAKIISEIIISINDIYCEKFSSRKS